MIWQGQPTTLNFGNTFRYNISVNDARKNTYAGILISGHSYGNQVYNNTVYLDANGRGDPAGIRVLNDGDPSVAYDGGNARCARAS